MTSTNNTNITSGQRRTMNIKKEYIQKLSNDKALAEAILIGKKPYLAIVDFSDPDNVRIGLMESLLQRGYATTTRTSKQQTLFIQG